MLKLENVTKTYKNGTFINHALHNVSVQFDVGDFIAILGESGSGKSTLLNVVSGLDTVTSGKIFIDGIDTSKFSSKDFSIYRNHYVGFIFQEYNLIHHLSLVENVELPLLFQGVNKKEARERALKKLELVGLSKHVHKKPDQISGGQQQRTSIARALVTEPKIIMADEPTGALDSELSNKIIKFLKKICKDKIVILVTHDEDLAHEFANRIIEIEDGSILNDSKESQDVTLHEKSIDFKQPKMSFLTTLKFARNNFFSRIIRSLLTSLIVSIGFIAIFLLIFIILGVNTSVKDTLNNFIPEDQYQLYHTESVIITDEEIAALESLDTIDEVVNNYNNSYLYFDYQSTIFYSDFSVFPKKESNLSYDLIKGEFPDSNHEIIVSTSMAMEIRHLSLVDEENYDYVFDLIKNDEITLSTEAYDGVDNIETFTIVGMYEGQGFLLSQNAYDELADALPDQIEKNSSTAYAYLTIDDEEKIANLSTYLDENYSFKLVNSNSSILSTIKDYTYGALRILITLASVSLIVAGILIGIVIYTSIVERTKEIGILTSIGARQSNILSIFLAESGLIGLSSSIIATALSITIGFFINKLFNAVISNPISKLSSGYVELTLVKYNVFVIFGVIAISLLYAVLCGLIPALYSTKLKAINALRKE